MSTPFRCCALVLIATIHAAVFSQFASADPLPGEVLKFQQLPLDNLTYPVGDPASGQVVDRTFWGHDELSTAYNTRVPTAPPVYVGKFMADDFADKFNSPVVHVKWWGSYPNFNPDFPVNKFLISFESDIPASPTGLFSRPGQPLLNQVVTRGPLAPGSGTYTEVPVSPGGAPLFETLYQYNAELNINREFFQHPDTVYWLKIVALVDAPGATWDPNNPPPFMTQWGWHNRDYTKIDPLASTPPAVAPGEFVDGFVPGTPGVRVYHFQDDAVTGNVVVDFTPVPTPGPVPFPLFPQVNQDPLTFQPTHYIDLVDGPAGQVPGQAGISQFSKDLAFELYTRVPEPTSVALCLAAAVMGLTSCRKR